MRYLHFQSWDDQMFPKTGLFIHADRPNLGFKFVISVFGHFVLIGYCWPAYFEGSHGLNPSKETLAGWGEPGPNEIVLKYGEIPDVTKDDTP